MTRTILVALSALAVPVLFSGRAVAAEQSAQASAKPAAMNASQQNKLERFNGVIEKVDPATKDVVVQFHKEKVDLAVSDHTRILEGSKPLPFGDLKKGMWTTAEYRKEGGKLIAESMNVSAAHATKKMEMKGAATGNSVGTSPKY